MSFAALMLGLVVTAAEPPVRYMDQVFDSYDLATDIPYKETVGYQAEAVTLKLDVYSPTGDDESNRPAILWVHGGALMMGSKDGPSLETDIAKAFARRGYVVVCINYRLHPDPNPHFNEVMMNAMRDTESALNWVLDRSQELGVDPSRVALAGYSAGAEIITNLVYSSYVEGFDRSRVMAVVDLAGNRLFWTDALPDSPPCLIVHGNNDDINPYSDTLKLEAQLEAAQVPCELFTVQGADHFFNRDPKKIAAIEGEMAAFLYRLVAED